MLGIQNTKYKYNCKKYFKILCEILFTMYLKYKIHLCSLYFTKYFTKYKMSQWQRIFFQTACLQTLSQLMFNKFKQDCFDVKATASRMIRGAFSLMQYIICPTSKCILYFLHAKQNTNTSRCISNTNTNYIFKMYFKYKIQNTNMHFKYVFQILVFEILPSTDGKQYYMTICYPLSTGK